MTCRPGPRTVAPTLPGPTTLLAPTLLALLLIAGPTLSRADALGDANTAYAAGKFAQAATLYSQALRLDPDRADTFLGRGLARSHLARDRAAVADLTEAIILNPRSALAYKARAAAFFRLSEEERALADMTRAQVLDPTNARTLDMVAQLLATGSMERLRDGRRAVALATQACALTHNSSAGMLTTLAAACAEAGDFDSALKWQNQAIKLEAKPARRAAYQERLSLYTQHLAFHEPESSAPRFLSGDSGDEGPRTPGAIEAAAAAGDPDACMELAERLLDGDGGRSDPARARQLYETAAHGHVANAWFKLGRMYTDGTGIPVDMTRGLACYLEASRRCIPEALYNVGSMLVSGRGVKRDFVEGLAWIIDSGRAGADSADGEAQVRAFLASHPARIEAARRRADDLWGKFMLSEPIALATPQRNDDIFEAPAQDPAPVTTDGDQARVPGPDPAPSGDGRGPPEPPPTSGMADPLRPGSGSP